LFSSRACYPLPLRPQLDFSSMNLMKSYLYSSPASLCSPPPPFEPSDFFSESILLPFFSFVLKRSWGVGGISSFICGDILFLAKGVFVPNPPFTEVSPEKKAQLWKDLRGRELSSFPHCPCLPLILMLNLPPSLVGKVVSERVYLFLTS